MKVVVEKYRAVRLVSDDGSDVSPSTKQKIDEIARIVRDAKVLGENTPVNDNVCLRIAAAILTDLAASRRARAVAPHSYYLSQPWHQL